MCVCSLVCACDHTKRGSSVPIMTGHNSYNYIQWNETLGVDLIRYSNIAILLFHFIIQINIMFGHRARIDSEKRNYKYTDTQNVTQKSMKLNIQSLML